MKKIIHVILIVLANTALADNPNMASEWAKANSECAGFYFAVQSIVKPDARPEYWKKYVIHLSFAEALQKDPASNNQQLNADITAQSDLLNQATTGNAKIDFFKKGMLGCNNVESHTPLVIKEHGLQTSTQPIRP
jgi:hypothetical protein